MFVCILFLLPTAHPVNGQNMNYAVVAIGGLLNIVGASWVGWGRKQYTGARQSTADGQDEKAETSAVVVEVRTTNSKFDS